LGKTPNGTGDRPDGCAGGVASGACGPGSGDCSFLPSSGRFQKNAVTCLGLRAVVTGAEPYSILMSLKSLRVSCKLPSSLLQTMSDVFGDSSHNGQRDRSCFNGDRASGLGCCCMGGCSTRRHNRLSVAPLLSIRHHLHGSHERFGLTASNDGPGPALVTQCLLEIDGSSVEERGDNGWKSAITALGLSELNFGCTTIAPHGVIGSGETVLTAVRCSLLRVKDINRGGIFCSSFIVDKVERGNSGRFRNRAVGSRGRTVISRSETSRGSRNYSKRLGCGAVA
jgi:hypothetical protein